MNETTNTQESTTVLIAFRLQSEFGHDADELITAEVIEGLNRLSASVRIWTVPNDKQTVLRIMGLNRLSASVRIWTG